MELNKTQAYIDGHSFDLPVMGKEAFEVLSYFDAKAASKLAVYEYIQLLFDRNPTDVSSLWESLVYDQKEIESQYKNVIKKWM
jgi:hypothetical protein